MNTCVFCGIASGKIPARIVYEDDCVVAIHDINPQAPVHILIIPRRHLVSVLETDDEVLLGRMVAAGARIARTLGVAERGFRLVLNTNRDAGQSVDHLHMHLLAGRVLGWPPG